MQGNLSDEALAGVISRLRDDGQSGVLHLSRGNIQKRIYFRGGSMVFANSDVPDDRLGQFLIRTRRIDTRALERAVEITKRKGQRFGKTMIEMGLIRPDDVQPLVAQQIRSIVQSLFRWDSGRYWFERCENPVDDDIALSLPDGSILLEGVRRMSDLKAIRKALGDCRRVLVQAGTPMAVPPNITLTPAEAFVLSQADGRSSVADILSISPLGEEETMRCVYGLVAAGMLRLGPAVPSTGQAKPCAEEPPLTPEERALRDDIVARHASLDKMSHYGFLGVRITASPAEIKNAYQQMAERYRPDRSRLSHLGEVQGMLRQIYARVEKAYQILSSPQERSRYDSSLRTEAPRGDGVAAPRSTPAPAKPSGSSPAERAKANYQDGKRFYDEKNYHDAIQCFREAVRLDSTNALYHKSLALSLARNPRWIGQAEEHFRIAMDQDPTDIETYLALAEIYEGSGQTARAQRMYRMVLDNDPANEIAREKFIDKPQGVMNNLRTLWRRGRE